MNEVQRGMAATFFFLFSPPLLTSQPRSTLINAAGHCARIKGSHPWWDRNAYRNLMPYDATFEYRIVSFRVNFMYIYIYIIIGLLVRVINSGPFSFLSFIRTCAGKRAVLN